MKASIQVSLWFGMKEEGQESKISFDVRRLILPTKPGLEISCIGTQSEDASGDKECLDTLGLAYAVESNRTKGE